MIREQFWRGNAPVSPRLTRYTTTTKTGLKVECALDERTYEKGIRI